MSVGSGTVSLNTVTSIPPASNGPKHRRTNPDWTMYGSVTTSGRDSPS